jgi:hypothetical protein
MNGMCERLRSALGVILLHGKTMTEHLPCLSESVFVEVVMCASRLSSAGACNISVSTAPLTPRPKSSSTSRSAAASLFRMITYAAVNDAPDAEEELHLRLAQSKGWPRNNLFSRRPLEAEVPWERAA